MSEEDLIHCVYTSAESIEFTHEEIIALLEKARVVNASLDISGMLLYEEGSFFQVLEGPEEAVTELYKKISADKRHDKLSKVIQESIEERDFAEWTMGYSGVTKKQLNEIEGLNDFFHTRRCYTQLDEGRAKLLLEAFKNGQWRASLT